MADENNEPTLESTLKELAGVDPDEFANTLHKVNSSLYQRIFNDGHKAASGKLGKETESLTEQLESLKSEREKMQEEIKSLREDQPDLEEVRTKYEAALQKKDQEVAKKNEEWQEKYSTLQTSVRDEKLNSIKTGVISYLKEKVDDPEYARIRASDPDLIDRINLEDDPVFYQKDGATPYSVPEDGSLVSVIGDEVLSTVPKKYLKNSQPGNTGLGKTDGGAPSNGQLRRSKMTDAEKADFIREHREAGRNGREEFMKLPE